MEELTNALEEINRTLMDISSKLTDIQWEMKENNKINDTNGDEITRALKLIDSELENMNM